MNKLKWSDPVHIVTSFAGAKNTTAKSELGIFSIEIPRDIFKDSLLRLDGRIVCYVSGETIAKSTAQEMVDHIGKYHWTISDNPKVENQYLQTEFGEMELRPEVKPDIFPKTIKYSIYLKGKPILRYADDVEIVKFKAEIHLEKIKRAANYLELLKGNK
ncbi:hypothetical protein [Arcticibacterium luteifluviistationis]|nr:hypothetical protein [Arcticibacterium luteifluviistationis]